MEKDNVIKNKSFDFALRIVGLYKFLLGKNEYVMSKQVLRSGTAVGALIRESEYAQSKKDFIHKLSIALKEANETQYWIQLLYHADYISKSEFESLENDVVELLKLLTSIINTSKRNLGN